MLIKLKPIYLSQLTKYLIVSGLIFSVCIFLFLQIDRSYCYMISMAFIFAGVLYMFYLNKNEVLTLQIEQSEVKISFVNNAVFKRQDMKLSKSDIICKKGDELIKLQKDEILFAIIRSKSLTETEWVEVKSYFNCN
jgi:hypothetical protein